jgi:hypothetical protein
MATNYNVNPYYDDYDETKQFYRILFRPGRAVQARELTQLQTSLQKQIERFGQSIYKEGSIVIPGGQSIDRNYKFVKLTASFGANTSDTKISSLINETITGANSKVQAIVVNSVPSTTAGDPPTIYVRYTSSSPFIGGSNTVFQANETIVNTSGNITLQVASTNPTGNGTSFSVSNGVVFTKGVFAYFDDQIFIVEKYTQANNVILGFEVSETTTTSGQDATLLDPAVGASNYIAPGADRYKISLDLSKRSLDVDTTEDANFIELFRLEDGKVISQNLGPQYSVLGDTLARRTFEESGNYTIRPYRLDVINHLRSSNTSTDGYYASGEGGNDDKLIAVVEPGKAYVRGYEIENVRSRYLIGNKARDFANVNNGLISTTIGNYIYVTNVFSIPILSTLSNVSLYDQFNSVRGTGNGNIVGTAKVSNIEFYSGTVNTTTAIYKLWLFDVEMNSGKFFERDVKQIFSENNTYADFTADISPVLTQLTGSVITTTSSNTITGIATRFTTETKVGDYITIQGTQFRVGAITNAVSITANTNATSTVSGVAADLNTAVVNDTIFLPHIFEIPESTIKTVDPTNLETSYDVKRSYSRTLSGNTVTITAGTNEIFNPVTTTNYILAVASGANTGNYIPISTTVLSRGGSPTGKTLTVNLTSLATTPANVAAYSTADIVLHSTINKTNSAANKKTKTLVSSATQDFISNVAAQSTVITLSAADIYAVANVKMSAANVAFGSPYSSSGEIDITDRYVLDNGQRLTFYDLGTLTLKPNQPKPTNPIRVTFDFFTHGTGDYFSVDSYSGIDYKDIPTFTSGKKTYQLRDCLDFRPRINNAGTGFTGTGAVVNDFIDPNNDLLTDYSYYLPRIDKISIDKTGLIRITEGVSSLNPKEPKAPEDTMPLFIMEQKAYVFDVKTDIDVTTIENKRYTMRDIGRIEDRVKNLEYYTTLNLLEKETNFLQIQDGDGFDRFKNGFIVDNFSGHGIGDVFNRDYGVAVDPDKNELRPICKVVSIALSETNTSTGQRTANNYTKTGDLITLPYTHESYIKNQKASKTENINPFSVIVWRGTVKLDPVGDFWFEQNQLPTIDKNENGNYDQFLADAKAKGTYGTIWGSWSQVQYGNQRTDIRQGQVYDVVEQIDKRTVKDVIVNKVIIPKMRSITIGFTGESLKPNTRVHIYFDDIKVTGFCSTSNTVSNTNVTLALNNYNDASANNLITDATGKIQGKFRYEADYFNLSTGVKRFKITDSPTDGTDFETSAQTTFTSNGELTEVRDENISTRNAVLNSRSISDSITTTLADPVIPAAQITATGTEGGGSGGGGGGGGGGTTPHISNVDALDLISSYMGNRTLSTAEKKAAAATQEYKNYATNIAAIDANPALSGFNAGNLASITGIVPNGSTGITINQSILGQLGAAAKPADMAVYQANFAAANALRNDPAVREAIGSGKDTTSLLAVYYNSAEAQAAGSQAARENYAVTAAAAAVSIAEISAAVNYVVPQVANPGSWVNDAIAATTNAIKSQAAATVVRGACANIDNASGPVDPLAQSFFIDRPLYLSKVDLFFSAKDSVIPMKIQIRKMVNGSPGPFVLPFSETLVYPSSINISDDGSTATTISFDSPVFLDSGEYALVLMAESINYRVWISQIGEADVLTNSIISEQPYIGVLFKSQNASTWSPDQYQDLKFTLYRAVFNTSVTSTIEFIANTETTSYGSIRLEPDPLEVSPNTNIMRVYHPQHGQTTGSKIRLTGFPLPNTFGVLANSNFFGIPVSELENVPLTVSDVTLNNYTITLPNTVNGNVSSTTRTGGYWMSVTEDVVYHTYYPVFATITPNGTVLDHKIKTTDTSYTVDTSYTPINVEDFDFNSTRVLASAVNREVSMSNGSSFMHLVEMSTTNDYVTPIIDTKRAIGGIFARNLINNPTYSSENFASANDIITIASANNIMVTLDASVNGKATITLTGATDKTNASSLIKGTLLNISANNGINSGQYRILNVTDSGANISVINVSSQNVTTNGTATYTITNGRNFIAEEAAFDGSVYSKYITRQVDFINPCTAFKFIVDTIKPDEAAINFYYKTSEVGDTIELKDKEYTPINNVVVRTSFAGEYYETAQLVEGLAQFDAIAFKITFTSTDSAKIPKIRNLRVVALA